MTAERPAPPQEKWLAEYTLKIQAITTIEAAIDEVRIRREAVRSVELDLRADSADEDGEVPRGWLLADGALGRALASLRLAERHLARIRGRLAAEWAAEHAIEPHVALAMTARDVAYEVGLITHQQFDGGLTSQDVPYYTAPEQAVGTAHEDMVRAAFESAREREEDEPVLIRVVETEGAIDRHQIPIRGPLDPYGEKAFPERQMHGMVGRQPGQGPIGEPQMIERATRRVYFAPPGPPETVIPGNTGPERHKNQCDCGHSRIEHARWGRMPCLDDECPCAVFLGGLGTEATAGAVSDALDRNGGRDV